MSPNRHGDPEEEAIAIRSLALRLPAGQVIAAHAHPWGQMVYATEGVMTVTTDDGAWVVPPHRAAWVPGDIVHEVEASNRVRLRTLYVRPDLTSTLPATCRVLSVSNLLRELVLEVIRTGMLRADVPAHQHLTEVILDQIRVTTEAPLQLQWPSDARARRVAQLVHGHPADSMPLSLLAQGSGASERTLERLFVAQTRMTFGRWRQQARLLHALRLLAAGESVTSTGMSVGFASTSAFVAMFRRMLGRTPGSYFRQEGAAAPLQGAKERGVSAVPN